MFNFFGNIFYLISLGVILILTYIIAHNSWSKEVLSNFGPLTTVLAAGFIWLTKSAYGKHQSELATLAKFEKIYSINLVWLKDNFDFIKNWSTAMDSGRPFTCQFGDFLINNEETNKINNLNLINKILSINYKLKRTYLDIDNTYKRYWEAVYKIDSIQSESERASNFQRHQKNTKECLAKMLPNYETLKKDLIDVLATITIAAHVRKLSIFYFLSFLFKDIYPKINEKAINIEVDKINKKIIKIEQVEEGKNI